MNRRHTSWWVVAPIAALLLALGLASCGGGGGEPTEVGNSPVTDNPSPTPTPEPDNGQPPDPAPDEEVPSDNDDTVNDDGEPDTAESGARLYIGPNDPTFARIHRDDGSTVTYSGTRDAQGYPDKLRQLVIGTGKIDPEKDAIVQIDGSGRTTQISSAEEGQFDISYGNDASVQFVWTAPETGDKYEVTLVDPTAANALNVAGVAMRSAASPKVVRTSGTVKVTCSRNGLTLPQPGNPPRVWEDIKNASGLLIDQRVLPVGTGVDGTFPYYLPFFGQEENLVLDETLSINRTIGAVRTNCLNQNSWLSGALSSVPGLIADKVKADLSAPSSVRLKALTKMKSLVGFVANTVCDVGSLSEKLFNQTMTTAWYLIEQTNLNAQVITAVGISEKVSWSFPVNVSAIPEQTVKMPASACPSRLLEGSWDGTLSQPNNLNSPEFRYALRDIVQSGNQLSGRSLIESISYPGCSAEIAVEGTATLNFVSLKDVSLTKNQGCPQNWSWCRKSGFFEVSRVNGAIELNGDWKPADSNCEPGRSRLRQN